VNCQSCIKLGRLTMPAPPPLRGIQFPYSISSQVAFGKQVQHPNVLWRGTLTPAKSLIYLASESSTESPNLISASERNAPGAGADRNDAWQTGLHDGLDNRELAGQIAADAGHEVRCHPHRL
jgi:hypothetical protein